MFNKGETVGDISRHIGMCKHVVSRTLEKAGLRHIKRMASRNPERDEAVAKAYAGGMPNAEIMAQFGICQASIPAIVRRVGNGLIRYQGYRAKATDPAVAKRVMELWDSGESLYRIMKQMGLSLWMATKLIKQNGAIVERRPMSGEKHQAWKGGRTMSHGYVYVKVADDDPHADMRDARGYCFEHRLVMARKLGRSLREDETVHHKDDDHTNNKPDNLQLRQGRHGKGAAFKCADCGSHNIVPVDLG